MGAGKSTLGEQLAKSLDAPFIDTDTYIVEKEGHTIREIFDTSGEGAFRQLEEKYLQDILEDHISNHPDTIDDSTHCTLVLSLGGGIVTNPVCTDLISRFTYCIYIKSDPETLFARLEGDTAARPLLQGEEGDTLRHKIETLYREREPLYESLARKII